MVLVAVLLYAGSGLFWRATRPDLPAPAPPAIAEATPSEDGEPSEGDLHFLQDEVDFGLIKELTRRDVEFENRGQQVLHILGVKTSCRCTASQPDRTTLQPGEKGRMTVTVDPRSEWTVERVAAVIVEYQGDSRQEARLRVRARFRLDVEVPRQITFRCVAGQPENMEFLLTDNRERPLKIKEIQTSSPDLHVEAEPSIHMPGREYFLKVSFTSGNRAPGYYTESITLHTTDRGYETISVTAMIEVVKRIRVVPETLSLKPDPGDASRYVGRISVEDSAGDPVEIESATPADESLRCQLDARRSSRRVIAVSASKDNLVADHLPPTIRGVLKSPVAEVVCVKVSIAPASSAASP